MRTALVVTVNVLDHVWVPLLSKVPRSSDQHGRAVGGRSGRLRVQSEHLGWARLVGRGIGRSLQTERQS